MKLILEKLYPTVYGILGGLIFFFFFRHTQLSASLNNLIITVVTISATAVGFLATIMSIFFTLTDKPIIKKLKGVGIYQQIIKYIRSAIIWAFVVCIFSAALFLFGSDNSWFTYLLTIWIFCIVTCIFACYRFISIFYKILTGN